MKLIVLLLSLVHANNITHPVITLSHGGQVKGTQFQMEKAKVAMFAGIPYAKPPIGNLRFRKPEPADSWTGEFDASVNNLVACPQQVTLGRSAGQVIGEEDCLYLDVWAPGDVLPSTDKKAVMVWIHGGGYVVGQGTSYPFMVFVDEGDVIVVSINYRLGPFGFLSEGEGTGNFGLWDQRQALVWVKENIDRFGGDPARVTIFGESAGGGSVSALTLSPQTEGLFHRAIPQSGALYCPWSWAHTERQREALNKETVKLFNCTEGTGLYNCLRGKSVYDVVKFTASDGFSIPPQHPFPDNDFFDAEVDAWSYNASRRFDLMTGYNGQDGLIFMSLYLNGFLQLFAKSNATLDDGLSAELSNGYDITKCSLDITHDAQELCAYFLQSAYKTKATDTMDNKERLRRLVNYETDFWFGVETRSTLLTHAAGGDKSTYGYVLTEPHRGSAFNPVPEWLKTEADHADDIPFLMGGPVLREAMNRTRDVLYKSAIEDFLFEFFISGRNVTMPLTDHMMRTWTNCDKSVNPNLPVQDPSVPDWPQYTSDTEQVMNLKLNPQVVTIPRKDTLQAMRDNIISIKERHHAEERHPIECKSSTAEDKKKSPQIVVRASAPLHLFSSFLFLIVVSLTFL